MLPSLLRLSVLATLMAPPWAAADTPAGQPLYAAQRVAYAATQLAQPSVYMATPGVLLAGHPTAGDAPIKRSASLDANPQPVTAPAAPRKTGASESLINAALASSIDPEFETSALALAILGLIGLIARRGAQR